MISKVLTVGLLALLLAGCSVAPPPSVAVRSPVDTLLADRFWTVYMRRQPPGPWLIYDYERVDRDLWAPAAAAAGSLAHR